MKKLRAIGQEVTQGNMGKSGEFLKFILIFGSSGGGRDHDSSTQKTLRRQDAC